MCYFKPQKPAQRGWNSFRAVDLTEEARRPRVSHNGKKGKEGAVRSRGGKAFQAEGTASAKALRRLVWPG